MKKLERLNFFKMVNWKDNQFELRTKDFVTFGKPQQTFIIHNLQFIISVWTTHLS